MVNSCHYVSEKEEIETASRTALGLTHKYPYFCLLYLRWALSDLLLQRRGLYREGSQFRRLHSSVLW